MKKKTTITLHRSEEETNFENKFENGIYLYHNEITFGIFFFGALYS